MNAVPTIPQACAGNGAVTGEKLPAANSAAGSSSSLLASLFPQLFGDLLVPETAQDPKPGKKQADQDAVSGLMPPVGLPVPVAVPAAPVRLPLCLQISADACAPAPQAMMESKIPAASGLAVFTPGVPVAQPEPSVEGLPTPPTSQSGEQIAVAAAPNSTDPAPALVPGVPPISRDEPRIVNTAAPSPEALTMPVAGSVLGAATAVHARPDGLPAPTAGERPAATSAGAPSAATPADATAELWEPISSTAAPPEAARAAAPNRPERPVPELTRLALGRDVAAPPPSVAPSVAAHAASRLELAFAARLSVVEPAAESPGAPHGGSLPAMKPGLSRPENPSPAPPAEFGTGTDTHGSQTDSRPARADGPTPRPAYRLPDDSGRRRTEATPPLHNPVELGVEFSVPAPVSRETPPAARPQQRTTTAPPEPPQPTPLAAPAQAARDIRLQVHGGEQRVEVRLTERAGEVQVAVRTPDARLTEALRSDLPALSARLEQTGFHAETWHPAAGRPEHYGFTPDPSSSGSAAQGQTGQRHSNPQDREQSPRHAPAGSTQTGSDAPPQEFSWLFSSLR